jgi:putative pyruvate formate lyase activating enzyme
MDCCKAGADGNPDKYPLGVDGENPMTRAAYRAALDNGTLERRAKAARARLNACTICPRACDVDRTKGETGVCRTGRRAMVSSFDAHFGEEAPISGEHGSGTIFFTHCNLLCHFCQNREISHEGRGQAVTAEQLAAMMLQLEAAGCHNINLVTPSHVVPQILEALLIAARRGLAIPIVYNTSGYDRVHTLRLLDGIVDMYMPDIKFLDTAVAKEACDAEDYPAVVRRAVAEMHRQVGDLKTDRNGIARSGLLVRHLVLPGGRAGTAQVMAFIADSISPATYVNVMAQYHPCGPAASLPAWQRTITSVEYEAALQRAAEAGLRRLDRRKRSFLIW